MAKTPDRKPGPLQEDEELQFQPNTISPSQEGAMNYDGYSFVMRDAEGNFNPRSTSDFDNIVLDESGRIVYVGNGLFVLGS